MLIYIYTCPRINWQFQNKTLEINVNLSCCILFYVILSFQVQSATKYEYSEFVPDTTNLAFTVLFRTSLSLF